CVVATDRDGLRRRVRALMDSTGEAGAEDDWLDHHRDDRVAGTLDEVRARLACFEEAGVQRVMLQHLVHDDLDMVELLGRLS
ncbi:MAG: hypothetical protein ACRD12_02440, partial [Acidimicrobiales bacterium]